MITGETIWITGASSGIGEALALSLAGTNNRVIATARDSAKLNKVKQRFNHAINSLPGDITDRQALTNMGKRIEQEYGFIDRVIINAGTCEYFDVANPDWEMAARVMNVNFFGAINTLAVALPLLKKSSRKPHIVVIASLASVVPFPRSEAYGASKAAVQYYFDSLRIDLAAQGIAVTVVQPGFVETPLTSQNDFDMPTLLKVDAAADIILRKIEDYPLLVSFPKRLAWTLYCFRWFPGLWHWIAVNKLSRSER